MQSLAIAYESDYLLAKASQLAIQLDLPIDNKADQQLLIRSQGLFLKIPPFSPICADFSQEHWQKRHKAGKKQGLVLACKPKPGLNILDATSGWGRDAAILASFGAKVTMLERNPILAALLQDALDRQDKASKAALSLQCIHQDAISYLSSIEKEQYPDIIYLDPMHPERQKSALVKKELQVLQQLIGPDKDVLALLKLAIQCAKQKVVLKWPLHAPSLITPSASIRGKTVKFEIYVVARSGSLLPSGRRARDEGAAYS